MKIARRVMMTGDNYLSPKMQVPDTTSACIHQPEKIFFTWNSMFGNGFYGGGDDLLLGNKGTIFRKELDEVPYVPQGQRSSEGTVKSSAAAPDIVSVGVTTPAHLKNFFDCVRSRKEPNCPFEIGFRSAIACQMAIASYRRSHMVHWDERSETIL